MARISGPVSPRRPLDLALVGMGRWGQTIARVAAKLPEIRIAAVASRNPEAAALAGEGCELVPHWRQLIEMPGLDGIIVACPPEHHEAPAHAAMEAGLPVLIEKPLTVDLAAADRLLTRARKTQAVAMVDHIQLHALGLASLREQLPTLGRMRRIRLRAGNDGPLRPTTPVLWDWAPHDLAIALWLTGGVQDRQRATLRAARVTTHPESQPGFRQSVRLELDVLDSKGQGVEVDIRVSNALGTKERSVRVEADGGQLEYREYPRPEVRSRLGLAGVGEENVQVITGPGPLDRVLSAFAAAIRGAGPAYDDLYLGREIVRLLAQAERMLGASG